MGFTDKKDNIVGFDIDPCKRSNKENGNQIKITANQLEFQRTGT